ncbi:MAG: hypothetical protein IAE95_13005 [Chitinophagaceae bacterium]|nr:hypothetical protein [Chitinophagaceae bacterium]
MTNESTSYRQPWLRGALFDSVFILLPGLFALLLTFVLPSAYKYTDEMPTWGWVVLVLLVDVAHVYSTLFRTYFDKERFTRHRVLYTAIPVACLVAGVLLYSMSALAFWRSLAYLAVFHFVRQQYGFMRLYSRAEARKQYRKYIDATTIYAATIYPLVYWHCSPGRNFSWFVQGDFVVADLPMVRSVALYIYVVIVAVYCVLEIGDIIRYSRFNVPRNVLLFGTLASWYVGIVHFNGDMAFTMLNVVAHGIPYMALIWLLKEREDGVRGSHSVSTTRYLRSAFIFIGVIFIFSYLEEGLWDGLVWREHASVFPLFSLLPHLTSKEILSVLVPLLSLPQSTHYVLDGFIWKRGHS